MRKAVLERNTNETKIKLSLDLDGTGEGSISTGVGFFDHMLSQISRHGFMDLEILAVGDLNVDSHHTIEDTGIILGSGIKQALGDKTGIRRYGDAIIPMDESLALCAIDLSGRAYLRYDAHFNADFSNNMGFENIEEFFRSLAFNGGMNIHLKILEGNNNHHMAEAMFKAFGRALVEAVSVDLRVKGILSTKGML